MVEPEWLAEMGPMFFSIKDSHLSRLERRKKEKAEKASMEKEMADAMKEMEAEKEKELEQTYGMKKRKQSVIATPGMRTPLSRKPSTPRRVGL
tara:strand:- start:158 stop:436 length:279 start_codon:yes stop_codon:yes gene_type:complete